MSEIGIRITELQDAALPLDGSEWHVVDQGPVTRRVRGADLRPDAEVAANKNQPNGYAGLDASGRLRMELIPASLVGALQFQGVWNARDNVPFLSSSIGVKGQYYKVSIAGSTPLNGQSSWQVGDMVVFNGTTWDQISGQDGVLKINGKDGPEVILTAFDIPFNATNAGAVLAALLAEAADHEVRIDSLESSRTTDEARITALENAQESGGADVAELKGQVDALQVEADQTKSDLASYKTANNAAVATLQTNYTALNNAAEKKANKGQANGYAGLDASGQVPLAALTAVERVANKAQPNGYASLGSDGRVPASQLPAGLVSSSNQGPWDANANLPHLESGTGTEGWFYVVSVAGSTNLDGISTWQVNDLVLFQNGHWTRVPAGDAVKQVNGKRGVSVTVEAGDIPAADTKGLGKDRVQGQLDELATRQAATSLTVTSLISDVNGQGNRLTTLEGAAERTANKGQAGGYAALDGTGRVPLSQLPAAVTGAMTYQGTWDPVTNTPTLTSGSGTRGYYYTVTRPGSTSLDGHNRWYTGDKAAFNGTVWEKFDGVDGEVLSVNGIPPGPDGNVTIPLATSADLISAADPNGLGATNVQDQLNTLGSRQATDHATIGDNTTRIGNLETGKQSKFEKGQPNGYASLDNGGKVPLSQIPSGASTGGGNVSYTDTYGLVGAAGQTTTVQAAIDRLAQRRMVDAGYNGPGIDAGYNGS